MPQAGLLVQVDGSQHDWLEGRGPRLVLHGAIDDATNEVPAALFRLQEDAAGYLGVLREMARRRGLDHICCFTYARTVANDNTVRLGSPCSSSSRSRRTQLCQGPRRGP